MSTKQNINELVQIQSKLKAPKGQFNKFGGYRYRSCEDILEAVKPLLLETGCTLIIADDVLAVGDRVYIKATATLTAADGKQWQTSAFAREAESKKGMDDSQVTGTASSYARKYALNGLFCIDDTKDADALNTSADYTQKAAKPAAAPAQVQTPQADALDVLQKVKGCTTQSQLLALYNTLTPADQNTYKSLFSSQRKSLTANTAS